MATPSPTVAKPEGSNAFLKDNLREYGLLLALVVIMAFFQWKTEGALFQPLNLTNLILQNGYIIVMALGMLLVIVSGHIDLSVGSVCGFIGAVAAVLMVNHGWHYSTATIACILLGGLIGAAQGYWVAYYKIPAFIVTLAGMLVFKGLALAVLEGASVGPFPPEFQLISTGFIPDFLAGETLRTTSLLAGVVIAVLMLLMAARERSQRSQHGMRTEPLAFFGIKNLLFAGVIVGFAYMLSQYKGLPNVLVVTLVLILLFNFITTKTTIGRRIYAIGGNEKAARLSGIRTERLTFYTFISMGMLSALAGLIFAARLNVATPKAGVGFELDVIAACFIGGASASGGVGKVLGAVVGAFIMGVMNNGMSIMGIGIEYQQVIKGLVLLAAVWFDVYNKNK
ncbi:sugar ABC transporter permease [Curvibacter sp. CHRR-16]|uniref:multiple monosaccharide ABC transporter permease n=1 Tax=Curvibacter sp. CHRR-16 TaxID=2835872 RepID=UPI001BD9D105|nr:multiple monosaccharide ABC transporter permease [Curvibacter sp. CHRR-16]MBT0570282.1 sugar ABC transporter permease [Curvibacter sp. CHRR-16]